MRAYALGALLAALALYGAFDYGCRYTENRIRADAQTRIAKLNAYSAALQQKLDTAQHHIETRTKIVKERILYAVTHVVYQDRIVERPVYYLTRADILLYNASFGLPDASPCADGSLTCPQDLTLTGTSLTDLYSTTADNGAACQTYRDVAIGWQTWWAKVSGL